MPKYEINEKEIERLKKIEGKARGQTIINALQSILIMEGEEGLIKLEQRLKELGCWVDNYKNFSKNVKAFDWYPLWQDMVPIVVAAAIFDWDEEKIKEFGVHNQKLSFFEKVLLKYFVSFEIVVKTVTERWKKHYNIGYLENTEANEKERRVVFTLKDLSVHPVFCLLLSGYFQSAGSFVLPPSVTCEETKCTFRGDKVHEYLITW